MEVIEAKGIDVSSNNHKGMPFNWPAAKAAGYDIVYIKATQGVNYVNPYFIQDCRDAANAGFKVGIYHFYTAADNPIAQAAWFITNGIEQVKEYTNLLPVVDVEQGIPGAALEASVNMFLADIHTGTSDGCIGYMNRDFFAAMQPNYSADWYAYPGWSLLDARPSPICDIVQYGQLIVPGIGEDPTGKQSLTDVNDVLDLANISTTIKLTEDMTVMDATTNSKGQRVIYAVSAPSGVVPAGHLYEFTKTSADDGVTPPVWSVIDVTDVITATAPADPPFLVQP